MSEDLSTRYNEPANEDVFSVVVSLHPKSNFCHDWMFLKKTLHIYYQSG